MGSFLAKAIAMPRTHRLVDPDELTSDERLEEIAAIFAQGCRRLVAKWRTSGKLSEISPEPVATCLDPARADALMDEPVDGTGERRAAA